MSVTSPSPDILLQTYLCSMIDSTLQAPPSVPTLYSLCSLHYLLSFSYTFHRSPDILFGIYKSLFNTLPEFFPLLHFWLPYSFLYQISPLNMVISIFSSGINTFFSRHFPLFYYLFT